jgi:hypothetical protein
LVFKFALEYAIRRVQVNEKGFKLNVRHQIVLYARNGNTLGESKHTVKKKKKHRTYHVVTRLVQK